jgi:hypothetical protein
MPGIQPIAVGTINTNLRRRHKRRAFLPAHQRGRSPGGTTCAAEAEIVGARGPASWRTDAGSRAPMPPGPLFVRWGGAIESLFPWFAGRTLARAELTPVHRQPAVGTALAKLHPSQATAFRTTRPGRYGAAENRTGASRASRALVVQIWRRPSAVAEPELARLRAERVADYSAVDSFTAICSSYNGCMTGAGS